MSTPWECRSACCLFLPLVSQWEFLFMGLPEWLQWPTHNNEVKEGFVGHVSDFLFIVSFAYKLHSRVCFQELACQQEVWKMFHEYSGRIYEQLYFLYRQRCLDRKSPHVAYWFFPLWMSGGMLFLPLCTVNRLMLSVSLHGWWKQSSLHASEKSKFQAQSHVLKQHMTILNKLNAAFL